jgi:hypothetical protein
MDELTGQAYIGGTVATSLPNQAFHFDLTDPYDLKSTYPTSMTVSPSFKLQPILSTQWAIDNVGYSYYYYDHESTGQNSWQTLDDPQNGPSLSTQTIVFPSQAVVINMYAITRIIVEIVTLTRNTMTLYVNGKSINGANLTENALSKLLTDPGLDNKDQAIPMPDSSWIMWLIIAIIVIVVVIVVVMIARQKHGEGGEYITNFGGRVTVERGEKRPDRTYRG